ncbi:formylglycine-generating enzyme family protein [Actinomadura rugatobispora]|uniref:Formylglycine-generating enzyme family protein n=1 Tax=Actinomadura rugatobispora TaxID=1994 RepID=A0ABW1A9L7_9ACTN
MPDLIRISGWPSVFTRHDFAGKPVGCGAAFTRRALLSIFGSRDPEALRKVEDAYFSPLRDAHKTRPIRADDVVLVPEGPFTMGVAEPLPNSFGLDGDDGPARVVELPAFRMDRCVVSNERYRLFLEDIGDDRSFDHPDQSPERDHRPSHWHDPRFNRPELPVVGIDWYDAWAFANWSGGFLPTEEQWEKAARGTDGRRYPWGGIFDPERVNDAERSFGRPIRDIDELERLLTSVTGTHPGEPVLPVDALPAGASPFGAIQMSGNVWEMTRTNFFTRKEMDPFFKGRKPVEFMNRKDAFHVLRGGTWTSPPDCLATSFRGKDLLTDRHNEVGFRCAYPAAAP